MANPVILTMKALLAEIEEEERLEMAEAANRESNIASWKLDEEPDPCEA